MKNYYFFYLFLFMTFPTFAQKKSLNDRIISVIDQVTDQYNSIYVDLHQNPELSLLEFKTAEKMASNLESLGFEVHTNFGGTGVVGIFRNGKGKVIMLRTDMDALPVKETTGLPYASSLISKDASGNEVPVMHACGHDLHMTVWLGVLNTLVTLKSEWKGTIVAIAQAAEELSAGAIAMINDGLFRKFPVPDYALAYHVSSLLPAGTIGYNPGSVMAGVNSVNLKIFGSGGHGAMPHTTIDPVVLAARVILDLQTIVSREIDPVKPAVVTVGAIHGGVKNNIIPDEVELLLTFRFFDDEVHEQIKEAIIRISRGLAASAGLPEEKMPQVTFPESYNLPVANNSELVNVTVKSMRDILGQDKVVQVDPVMTAEDFNKYGRTEEKIPIALFWMGGVKEELYRAHLEDGKFLPPLHNPSFAPDFKNSFRGGVAAMSKAMIDLFGNK